MKRIVVRTAKTVQDKFGVTRKMLVDGIDPRCYFLVKCISDHRFVPSVSFTTRFEIINVITDVPVAQKKQDFTYHSSRCFSMQEYNRR